MNQTTNTSAHSSGTPLHVVCPHCHTTNRVAADDLSAAPTCGKCQQPLFTGQPLALDEAGFERHVSRSHLPVLVDFWAPWCGPCRMLAPTLEELAREAGPSAKIVKVNVDDEQDLAGRYGIMSIPTVIAFKGGQPAGKIIGLRQKGDYQNMIR